MFQCYIQLLQSQKVSKKIQQEKPVEEESDVVNEGRKMENRWGQIRGAVKTEEALMRALMQR